MEHKGPLLATAALLAALPVAGCATPNIGADVAMTGMPSTKLALCDSVRVTDAGMGKVGVLGTGPRVAGPVVPGELLRVAAFS